MVLEKLRSQGSNNRRPSEELDGRYLGERGEDRKWTRNNNHPCRLLNYQELEARKRFYPRPGSSSFREQKPQKARVSDTVMGLRMPSLGRLLSLVRWQTTPRRSGGASHAYNDDRNQHRPSAARVYRRQPHEGKKRKEKSSFSFHCLVPVSRRWWRLFSERDQSPVCGFLSLFSFALCCAGMCTLLLLLLLLLLCWVSLLLLLLRL